MKAQIIRNTVYRILCICLIFVLALSLSVGHVDAASTPAKGNKPSLSSKTNTSITMKWKASKNAKKYQLAYKKKGGSWKNYKKTTAKSLTVSSLKASTNYYFRVRGINGSKYGKWSLTSKVVKTYATPKKVSGLFASKRTSSQLEFTWKKVSEASWYDVALQEVGSSYSQNQTATKNNIPYTYSGFKLYPNTWYYVKVRTAKHYSNGTAYSAWTTMYTCTTSVSWRDDHEMIITSTNGKDYTLDDESVFTMGKNDSLIPMGIYYITEGDIDDIETDTLSVQAIRLLDNEIFDSYSGGTPSLKIGSTFKGSTVKSITLEPYESADRYIVDAYQAGTKHTNCMVVRLANSSMFVFVW